MIRPTSSRITTTKSLVTATMLFYAPAPHIEDTVQSSLEHHYRQRLLCQHLEQCYTQSLDGWSAVQSLDTLKRLDTLKTDGVPEPPSSASLISAADSQAAAAESAEARRRMAESPGDADAAATVDAGLPSLALRSAPRCYLGERKNL